MLLDTSVVSELRKSAPDRNVVNWARSNAQAGIYISPLVIGEIRHGIEKVRDRDPRRADALEAWLDNLEVVYQDRIRRRRAPGQPVRRHLTDAWASAALPGSAHDLTAARTHGIIAALTNAGFRGRPW